MIEDYRELKEGDVLWFIAGVPTEYGHRNGEVLHGKIIKKICYWRDVICYEIEIESGGEIYYFDTYHQQLRISEEPSELLELRLENEEIIGDEITKEMMIEAVNKFFEERKLKDERWVL